MTTFDRLPAVGITENSTSPGARTPVTASGSIQYAAGELGTTPVSSGTGGFAINGAVKQVSTNLIVAAYEVDIDGFGTITYPDRSTDTITAFAIRN